MKNVFLLVSIAMLIISCNQANNGKEAVSYEDKTVESIAQNSNITIDSQKVDGYTLMKENCYVCHNPNTKSHDDIIAPPFKGVKMHYTRQYENKEDFVNAVVNWVQDPNEDNALMYGAVMKFKVMPKLPMETKELEKIADYIYDNDVEEPEWMGEHQKEKGNGHGKQGKGNGMRKGKGKGRGMNMYNN